MSLGLTVADPLSRHPAFLNVLLAVSTRSKPDTTKDIPSPVQPKRLAREVRSMLEGSNAMRNSRKAYDTCPEPHAEDPLGESDVQCHDNPPDVWGSSPDPKTSDWSTEQDRTADPNTTVPYKDNSMTAQSRNDADLEDRDGIPLVVPEADPQDNLQWEDLALVDSFTVDGDSIPNSPFNESAKAVLKRISNAYSGDAYFNAENADVRARNGIVPVEDQALNSQHADGIGGSQSGPG